MVCHNHFIPESSASGAEFELVSNCDANSIMDCWEAEFGVRYLI